MAKQSGDTNGGGVDDTDLVDDPNFETLTVTANGSSGYSGVSRKNIR